MLTARWHEGWVGGVDAADELEYGIRLTGGYAVVSGSAIFCGLSKRRWKQQR